MKWLQNLLQPKRDYEKNAQALVVILRARIKELEENLRNIEKAALPDPYDERDISLEWLRKIIYEEAKSLKRNT